jgi:hypothetical protein
MPKWMTIGRLRVDQEMYSRIDDVGVIFIIIIIINLNFVKL